MRLTPRHPAALATSIVASLSTAALLLTGCSATDEETIDPPVAAADSEPTSQEQPASGDDSRDSSTDSASGDVTIPAGARAASPEFPFPVPEDWEELEPFVQDTIGKDVSMSAMYRFPGDARAAADHYMELLNEAGFSTTNYAPGELTNDAALFGEGRINGQAYSGMISFDTDAAGTQRASINLTEDN